MAYILRTALLLGLTALSALAQNKPSSKEMDSFRLSMEKVHSTMSVYSNLIDVLGADAGLRERFKAEKKRLPDTNGRDTMGLAAERLILTEPKIAAAFAKAGTNPKQSAMTLECLMGVMMGAGMLEATKTKPANLPPFVADNLAFYQANKDAVHAAFKRLQESSAKVGASLEDDEDEEEGEPEEQ